MLGACEIMLISVNRGRCRIYSHHSSWSLLYENLWHSLLAYFAGNTPEFKRLNITANSYSKPPSHLPGTTVISTLPWRMWPSILILFRIQQIIRPLAYGYLDHYVILWYLVMNSVNKATSLHTWSIICWFVCYGLVVVVEIWHGIKCWGLRTPLPEFHH